MAFVHHNKLDRTVEVPDSAVVQMTLSGWTETEPPPPAPRALRQPPGKPEQGSKVQVRHAELQRTIEIPASAVEQMRESGWTPVAETKTSGKSKPAESKES